MSCTKNKKKFLFIHYSGSHREKDSSVKRFGMYSWAQYTVSKKCELCGCNLGDYVYSESQMLEAGYDLQKLQELSSRDIFSKDASQLLVE